MKILTAFQITADLDLLCDKDWTLDDRYQVNTQFFKKVINQYDENALEFGLKIKDQISFNCQLEGLTIDNDVNLIQLQKLFAIGYDEITCINSDITSVKSLSIAQYLAQIIDEKKIDLVLMGLQGTIDGTMQIPYYLSEIVNYVCFSDVIDIKNISEKQIDLITLFNDQHVSVTVKLPAIIVISNTNCAHLRVSTIKDRMAAKSKSVNMIHHDFVNDFEFLKRYKQVQTKKCSIIKKQNDYETVLAVYENFLGGK